MADFFGNLAGLVLGTAPEVRPLLPPRFAPWPGMPLTGDADRLQTPAEPLARADAALLPPPLIDPAGPHVEAPLPTLRQMSQLGLVSGSDLQPLEQLGVEQPETSLFEADGLPPPEAASFPPDVEQISPGEPHAQLAEVLSAAEPVIARERQQSPVVSTVTGKQSPLDQEEVAWSPPAGATQNPVTANEAKVPPAAEPVIARERQQPSVVSTATGKQSPLDQEEAALRPPAGPAQDLVTANEAKAPPAAVPVIARERQQPSVVSTATGKQSPLDQEEAALRPPAGPAQDLVIANEVKHRHEYLRWQSPADHREVASPPNDGGSQQQVSDGGAAHRRQISSDGERNIERLGNGPTLMEPAGAGPGLGQQAAQPVVQRQPVAPLVPRPVPAAPPDLPVSTQVRQPLRAAEYARSTVYPEAAPPSDRALAHSREPSVVPAPEPAPGEVWLATRTTAATSMRRLWARPNLTEPEPAPTVRVTIGRVVVRAAPADEHPPARRVELPRPPVSLDEYLRGRQGGGR